MKITLAMASSDPSERVTICCKKQGLLQGYNEEMISCLKVDTCTTSRMAVGWDGYKLDF
jgi:hypothetical protein